MTTTFYTSSLTGAGIRTTITSGNSLYVGENAAIGSSDNFAIVGTGSGMAMDIHGDMYGDLGALSLANASSTGVVIYEGASLSGNAGSSAAIDLNIFSGAIENHGLLSGENALTMAGSISLQLSNFGVLQTQEESIVLNSTTTGSVQFINYGAINTSFGETTVYSSEGMASDLIINSGIMNGFISLGDSNDAYYGNDAKLMDSGYLQLILSLQGEKAIASYVDAGAGNDTLNGSKYVDYFFGGAGGDSILGDGGDDYIVGGAGRDLLAGGTGADQFIYSGVADSRGSKFDVIRDFSAKQHDKIDLASIDANGPKSNDQAFKFIGDEDFSGKPGELSYEFVKGNTIVYGNTDNDKAPEFELHLIGKIELHASDFSL